MPHDSGLPRTLGPPLVVWFAVAATVAVLAAAFGYDPSDSSTWSRWDSGLYEDIARDGYDLFPCPTPGNAPGTWCGDAGWFPAYPWLFGGLHVLGLPLRGSAVVVSWLFAAATIVLLWSTFLARRVDATAVAALLYAAVAPGQVYHYAVFPLSMLAFWTVAALWLLYRGRWIAAGATGAVATLCYPLAVLLVPVSAVWILAERRTPLRERLRRITYTSGSMLAGFCVLLVDQRVETGHWNAYFLVQEKYGHALQNPVVATSDALAPLVHGPVFVLDKAPAMQTALVTVALACVLGHAAARRRSLGRLDGLLLLWGVATWALPLAQANVSLQRSQAGLLPLAVLVARLPRPLLYALVVAAAAVAVAMEKLFLDGRIV